MNRFGKAESPIVRQTLYKKQANTRARSAVFWGLLNLVLAALLYYDMTFTQMAPVFHPAAWYIECGLAVLFMVNFVLDVLRYLYLALTASSVQLTARQRQLLGVNDSDIGFELSPQKVPSADQVDGTITFSPGSTLSTPSSTSTPGQRSSLMSSLGQVTPLSANRLSFSQITSPPTYVTPSPRGPYLPPGSASYTPGGQYNSPSPGGYGSSSNSYSRLDTSSLRSRSHNSSARRSATMSPDSHIQDSASLSQYLQEQSDRDSLAHLVAESSQSSGPSYWSWNRTPADFTPILRKYQYQLASRSPSTTTHNDDDPDQPSRYAGDEVWSRLDVKRDEVDKWTENIRKWLSQTILNRLVSEIRSINSQLRKIGCEEMEIGEVSISSLKQLASTKSQHVPTLAKVVPYLEVSTNQQYLIHRLSELGDGGCMSDFNWDGGSDFKGKPWKQHLPTDCQIVIHCLCTYFDHHIPRDPKYPDGKTFTTKHFLKTPEKPNLNKKDNMVLYQSKISPPHFKVILEDDLWDVRKGRNNMFHAILLFLHYIETKNDGMLDRVNVGLSGLNLLWVVGKRC